MRLLALALVILNVFAASADAAANPNAIAVIIGNKTYTTRGVPAVEYADRDAEAMQRYVVDVLGYDPQNVVVVNNASLGQMIGLFGTENATRGRLARMVGGADAASDTDVFVYYSGHGFPGLIDHKGYLLPVDADPNVAEATGYGLDLLVANLKSLGARSVVVVIDSCFSGEGSGGQSLLPRTSVMVRAAAAPPVVPHMTILTASEAAQPANWDVAARHGLMTEFFLRAVYGEANDPAYGTAAGSKLTARAVKRFLDLKMTRWAARELDREQNATLTGDDSVVLASVETGKVPSREDGALPPPAPFVPEDASPSALPSTAPSTSDSNQSAGAPSEQAPPAAPDRAAIVALATKAYEDKDYRQALGQFRAAADLGDTNSMWQIANIYRDGVGVPVDAKEALRWYRKAADLGEKLAMNSVGSSYLKGRGVPRDAAEAMRWFLKGADTGDELAMMNVGSLYEKGDGVSRSYMGALFWYHWAADAGEPRALAYIGGLYNFGRGVPQDYAEALKWFRKGADAEDPNAMWWLADYYEKGKGVVRNIAEAKRWYRKAADAGDETSKQALARLGG